MSLGGSTSLAVPASKLSGKQQQAFSKPPTANGNRLINDREFRVASYVAHFSPQGLPGQQEPAEEQVASRLPFSLQLNNRSQRARVPALSSSSEAQRRGSEGASELALNNRDKLSSARVANFTTNYSRQSEMKCSPRSYQQSINYRQKQQQQQQEMSPILSQQLRATSIPSPQAFSFRAEPPPTPRAQKMGDRLSTSQEQEGVSVRRLAGDGLSRDKYDDCSNAREGSARLCASGDNLNMSNNNNNTISNCQKHLVRGNYNQEGIVSAAGAGKLTPRLPRGVSKIPHQVRANAGSVGQSPPASLSLEPESELRNKYLTFSRDQASSHFKSLREEFAVGACEKESRVDHHHHQPTSFRSLTETARSSSSPNKLAAVEQQQPIASSTSTPLVISKPTERFNSLLVGSPSSRPLAAGSWAPPERGGGGAEAEKLPAIKCSVGSELRSQKAANQSQHQPVCEAFIMTGQSMMKLSCNESENNQLACSQQQRVKLQEVSKSAAEQLHSQTKTETTTSKPNGPDSATSNEAPAPGPSQTIVPTTNKQSSHLRESSRELPAGEELEPEQEAACANRRQTARPGGEPAAELTSVGVGNGGRRAEDDIRQASACSMKSTTTTTITNAETGPKRNEEGLPLRIEPATCELEIDRNCKRQQQQQPNGSLEAPTKPSSSSQSPNGEANGQSELQNERGRVEDNKIISKQEEEANIIPTTTTISKNAADNKRERFKLSKLILNGDRQASAGDNKSQNGDLLPAISPNRPQELAEPVANGAGRCSAGELATEPETPSTPTSPAADRDAARRLAKRLYNLSGFKRSDVCHHLSKSNPFSQTVAEEYLKLFDFRSMKLDSALRKFLSKLQLNGETQERERLLSQFSQRFYDCNKEKYNSADTIQTLVCALILLNTDLHGGHHKKKRQKLTLCAFIDGLNSSLASASGSNSSSANSGQDCRDSAANPPLLPVAKSPGRQAAYTFPRHLLVDLYESIKKRPLKCSGDDKCDLTSFEAELDKIYSQQLAGSRSNTLPTRRFAPGSNAPSGTMGAQSRRQLKQGLLRLSNNNQPAVESSASGSPESCIEFKLGYLNRKRVAEANGKPTGRGRRGWRRFHVSLKDLLLIMRPGLVTESEGSKQLQPQSGKLTRFKLLEQDLKNTSKIHHSFAWRSNSYTKRQFVFHLRLADQSEFLFQANNEQDLTSWIDTINFASACLSAPALPNAVASFSSTRRASRQATRRRRRPPLPVSYTRLTYWEQLINHEERLQRLKLELDEHLSEATRTASANKRFQTEYIEKIAYLKQEIERYGVYVSEMRKKSNSPEAIILSNHPQIASLTPSPEMILSLPSFSPAAAAAAATSDSQSATTKQLPAGGIDDTTQLSNSRPRQQQSPTTE